MALSRRTLLQAAATVPALPLAAPDLARAAAARTLRFVPQANLSVLDPIWTTAAVTIAHGFCVFDTLYGVDGKLQPHPQMAEGATVSDDGLTWLIRLRDGLRFHDGEPVRAQDCAASLERWSKRDTFGQTLAAAVDAFEAADDRTIRIRLKRPFPMLLDAIGKPHSSPAFMMPERLARTDPMKQITEMVGSGPFRFITGEYVSGARAAYERFDGYVPRSGAPDWTSGGKTVAIDRLEWTVIPDPATAAAALQRGEIDWWEQALPDLIPMLRKTPGVTVQQQDPYGFVAVARFNSAQPPFNNPRLRQIVLSMLDQDDYMQSIVGSDTTAYRECRAMFPCGMPGVRELGAELMKAPHDLAKGREAVKAAGYNGEKTVVINPTDYPVIGPHGQITAELLRALGFNVDLQEMDWGTVLQRRLSMEPADRGGWSIYHTNWPSVSIANPALNTTIRGDGTWPGWYKDAETERLTTAWVSAADAQERQALLDQVQRRALEGVPTLPLGQFFVKTAFRNELKGVRNGSVCYFWNVEKA
jgi:peptide/nickel transport system substrate-binding protein